MARPLKKKKKQYISVIIDILFTPLCLDFPLRWVMSPTLLIHYCQTFGK